MAKSISVVVPPNAAARVPVSKSSALVVPPNGISRCVCTSMPPGKTYFPMASSTRAAFCLGRFCPTTSILPALIAMSAKYVSVAVTTFPFAMIVSKPICPPFRRSEQEFYAKLPHFGPAFPEKSKGSPMEFGITLKPDISVERIVALTRQAESAGFHYGWIFDSHVLWKEPYPLLTLMAANTQRMRLSWAEDSPRVWIAGYGPKVLHMAGRVADGIILQFADPDLIAWCLGFVKEGARSAKRDWRGIEVMAAAPVWVSDDLGVARERVRWFPALVSNHVVDLIRQYKPEDLPPALTSYVQNRASYDYLHHCEVESSNANFVSDEVVDRFCIVGSAQAHREKLRKLIDAGVTQFNVYLMCAEEEQTLAVYQREILPTFQETATASRERRCHASADASTSCR